MTQRDVERRIIDAVDSTVRAFRRLREPRDPRNVAFAPWSKRAMAAGIDFFIYSAVCGAMLMLALPFTDNPDASVLVQAFVLVDVFVGVLGSWLLLPAWMLARPGARNGQTVGKKMVGIRAVRDDGKPWRFRTALWRQTGLKLGLPVAALLLCGAAATGLQATGVGVLISAAGAVAVLGLVFIAVFALWPLWGSERRGLHDRFARSHVIPVS